MPIIYYKNGAKKAEQYRVGADDVFIGRSGSGDFYITDAVNSNIKLSDLVALSALKLVENEELSGQLNGATVALTVANSVNKSLILNLNGGILIEGLEYTVSGTTLTLIGKYDTFKLDSGAGDILYYTYWKT